MRLTDLFLAMPGALVAIAIVSALGPRLVHTLIGISLVWWPYYARIIRGEVAGARGPPARGGRPARRRRPDPDRRCATCSPGVVPSAVVSASLDIGNVVLLLAGLSFLGLGQPRRPPSWAPTRASTLDAAPARDGCPSSRAWPSCR